MTRLHTLIRHCKKQSFSKTFALFLFTLILAGCAGLEDQLPGTAIPAAPTLEIGTATAALVIENSETSTEDDAGFPPPEDTTEPPTAIPEPTATITEAVERPTPTVQAISVPPNQPLDPNNLPPTNHDLAYISAGTLWLWTHHNRQIIPLFAPEIDSERFPAGTFAEVALVDFSADGNRAVVAVRYDLPPEEGAGGDGSGDSEAAIETEETGGSEFDIYFVDVVSKEAWLLVRGIENRVNELTISPNQAHIVFATAHDLENEEGEETNGRLFRINTPAGKLSDVVQIAECGGNCSGIHWRQDSELIIFSDSKGILLANSVATNADYILQNAKIDAATKQYWVNAWAPNDRAILISVGFGESLRQAIFDIPTQQIIDTPSGKITPEQIMIVSWLSDSRIFIATSLKDYFEPSLTTYRVDFDNGTLLADEELTLPYNDQHIISEFNQLQDGRFVFALQHPSDPNAAGLYKLTSFSEQPERFNGMPIGNWSPQIIWSVDGASAILVDGAFTTYVAAADGNLYQFNQAASQPTWLPPSNAQR